MAIGIKNAMKSKGISIDAIAAVLNIHRNSAFNKVNGKTPFNVNEAIDLQKNLFPEYALTYLFTEKNDTSQGENLTGT